MATGSSPRATRPPLGNVKTAAVILLSGITMLLAALYLIVRTVFFLTAPYSLADKILAALLLVAEAFVFIHGVGYLMEIVLVVWRHGSLRAPPEPAPPLKDTPPVAVVVSSYHEPLEVVERTVVSFYNLSYPNKRIFFLDDTRYDLPGTDPDEMQAYRKAIEDMCRRNRVDLFRRKWRGAKAGMINDFVAFLTGDRRQDFELQNFSGKADSQSPVYMTVFDADQNPMPDFLGPLISRMEAEPDLAFIQTPQYYTNFEANRVSRAAGLLQAVFYEYICEGKDQKGAMFCCGTNVVFRLKAFVDVKGFDESSVTEDFATSLRFHIAGWKSRYLSRVCAFGMGPEDLGAFFKQQYRWALGTMQLFPAIASRFLANPFLLSPFKWWEYFLSATHYLIGTMFLIMVICPIAFLLFSIPVYFIHLDVYVLLFVPYFLLTILSFFWTLGIRSYTAKDVLLAQLILAISFPVYIRAALAAFLRIRGRFVVTPKGATASLPVTSLLPQLGLAVLTFGAIVWGANRLIYEQQHTAAIVVNMIWALLQFLVLSSVVYFNSPVDTPTAARKSQ